MDKNYVTQITTLSIFLLLLDATWASFNNANDLFQLQFPGASAPGQLEQYADNILTMTTTNNEQYQCIVPPENDPNAQDVLSYDGPSANKLMEPLLKGGSCTLRVETYWTYELCHGMHIRQFHEEKLPGRDTKRQEFFLGKDFAFPQDEKFASQNVSTIKGPAKDIKVPTIYLDGKDIPYFEVIMGNGTACDLKGNTPRMTRVKYVCDKNGRGDILSLKETSTCEYEVILFSTHLCSHPLYRLKESPINMIQCHAMDGSPVLPEAYEALTRKDNIHHVNQPKQAETDTETKIIQSVDRATRGPVTSLADDQLLRDFLRGDYCLNGGQGWWKFEFCYGKYAQQYHQDKTGKTIVLLGAWDEDAHKKWWADAKTKTKSSTSTKQVTHFYSGGDMCDLTGKPRQVQVKLKCKESLGQHAVTIYLVEPYTCDYILGVEASIICPLLDSADEYGLLHTDVPKP
ncbi:endoplasmic reticulum lectin 1-like isoform X2 [Lytechinus variegatus]|uniref:endoplasmic reticulum lectin 1-like isoform X2 n=1 Tax=Lytechinus variegatus TaxID=7654 RepID=UPI001BB24B57|nr:endoplasmic reticulum lectin 1-like isoform X2 [Lytechinus variegatus]